MQPAVGIWKAFLDCIKIPKGTRNGLQTEGCIKGSRLVGTLQGHKLYVNDAQPVL